MRSVLDRLPWGAVLILCLTLGLAPFTPPHLFEKLSMLARVELIDPLDIFDLVFHGLPWGIAILKLIFGSKGGVS